MNEIDPHGKQTETPHVIRSNLFGREIVSGTAGQLARALLNLRPPQSVFFCNVHMLMLSRENCSLATAMDQAQLVFPDGAPVAWLQRRLGYPQANVLRGEVAVDLVCRHAAKASLPVGFFGSSTKVLDRLARNLIDRHEGLRINYLHSPPQIDGDIVADAKLVEAINSHELFCLFVGLGCPKQEKWASVYGPHLNCSVLAVGAAFDWLAGTTRLPPEWMTKSGLAWLFRLIQNPRKMWHRYFTYNSKFIFEAMKVLLKQGQSVNPPGNRSA